MQTCKLLFEECINREFEFTVSGFIYSLHREEYVRALFGLEPNLERLLQGKNDMFLMWLHRFSLTHGIVTGTICNFVNSVHYGTYIVNLNMQTPIFVYIYLIFCFVLCIV